MARNLFGQNRNRSTGRRQSERDQYLRQQEQRRAEAEERRREALAAYGDEGGLPEIHDADNPDFDESYGSEVSVTQPESYRQHDERKRDDARYHALLADMEEIRTLLGEALADRDTSVIMIKQQAGQIAQLEEALEKATNDAQQSAQAAALNENRTRQLLQELEERLDDAVRPVRSLQSHVTDMLEQNRRRVDDTTSNKERFGELATGMEHLAAQTDRTSSVAHGLRDAVDALRGEMDELRRDILRTDDAAKIVDQDSRRRIQGLNDLLDSYNASIDEMKAEITHTNDVVDDTRRSLVHYDPTFDELRTSIQELRDDVTTMGVTEDDRHEHVIDMLEEQRQEADARFDQLRHTIEERVERLSERLQESNDSIRDTGYKITEINGQIEELKQQDTALHRDIWYLHEQRVRVRLEQVQEELDLATAQRRDAEGEARIGLGSRTRRRRSDAAES